MPPDDGVFGIHLELCGRGGRTAGIHAHMSYQHADMWFCIGTAGGVDTTSYARVHEMFAGYGSVSFRSVSCMRAAKGLWTGTSLRVGLLILARAGHVTDRFYLGKGRPRYPSVQTWRAHDFSIGIPLQYLSAAARCSILTTKYRVRTRRERLCPPWGAGPSTPGVSRTVCVSRLRLTPRSTVLWPSFWRCLVLPSTARRHIRLLGSGRVTTR